MQGGQTWYPNDTIYDGGRGDSRRAYTRRVAVASSLLPSWVVHPSVLISTEFRLKTSVPPRRNKGVVSLA